MVRRVLHFPLFFMGVAPVVWASCVFTVDPRRAGVLVVLGAIGLVLNAIVLSGKRLAVGVPLRIIACGMAVIVLAAVLGMWHWIRSELLPPNPDPSNLEHAALLFQARNLIWIAGAAGYVLLTFLLLPLARPKPTPELNTARRVDFRTYGR